MQGGGRNVKDNFPDRAPVFVRYDTWLAPLIQLLPKAAGA